MQRGVNAGPWATTPALALLGATPSPSRGPLVCEFSLPDGAPALLALYDLAGRRLWNTEVGGLGAGRHQVIVPVVARLSPGIYLLHLTRGEVSVTRRVMRLSN